MAQRDARLQVPIDQVVLDKLQILADELGFDSVPALIRFWAKAETSDNIKNLRQRNLADPNAQVLHYIELILALNPSKPLNAEQAISYLIKKLQLAGFRKFFKYYSSGSSDKIFGT